MGGTEFENSASGATAERYAAGRMEAQEERDFEAALLENPDLAAAVNAAQRMRLGFRRLQERGELEGLVRRRPSLQPMYYGIAATVLLLIVGGGALLFRPLSRPVASVSNGLADSVAGLHMTQGNAPPSGVGPTFILVHTRSDNRPVPIVLPLDPTPLGLRIFPGTASDPRVGYQVTLERLGGDGLGTRQVWGPISVQGVAPDGSLWVYVDSSALRAGDYEISLGQGSHREGFAIQVSADGMK